MSKSLFFKSSILSVLISAVAFVGCGGGQQQQSGGNQGQQSNSGGQAKERSFGMDQANSALSSIAYSPGGQGFGYKTTAINPADFNTWATQFKPQITAALDQVGAGFVLQVTGHTCSIGPRDAVQAEGKLGNIYYSTERAKAVYQALINAGIPANRMTYKGIANDEPLSGVDSQSQRNRRVTFKIVPAPNQ